MTPGSPFEALEMLYAVGIPALFWIGLVAGVAVSVASSTPYFLGNPFFTRAYIGVVVLFVTGLVHRFLDLPYFGSMGLEYSLIIAGEAVFFAIWNAADDAASRRMAALDPKARICPKCHTIIDKIFRVCPRCDVTLPDEDAAHLAKREQKPKK